MAELHFATGYDRRFGTVAFRIHQGEDEGAIFSVQLTELIRSWDLRPEELAALMSREYQWTEGTQDIESARLRMLEETDFTGKVVLDIGGYDGFAAKIALDKGAKRAICLDNHQFEHYGWPDKRLDGVEYLRGDFMAIGNSDHPAWDSDDLFDVPKNSDLVIFFNVLYHLKNPWAALDHLRTLLKPDGEMLLCTLFRYSDQPTFYLYKERECNPSDATVYWGPSIPGLERLLKATGWNFEKYALTYDRVLYRCKPIADFVPTLAAEGYAQS